MGLDKQTRKTHNQIPQLLGRHCFYLGVGGGYVCVCVQVILRWTPYVPSQWYRRLIGHCQVLPAGCLDSVHFEPVCSSRSSPSFLPTLLRLHGGAAMTSWWSWVAAGCLGP